MRLICLPLCFHRAPSGARRHPGLDVAAREGEGDVLNAEVLRVWGIVLYKPEPFQHHRQGLESYHSRTRARMARVL